jgi:aminopeptidase N
MGKRLSLYWGSLFFYKPKNVSVATKISLPLFCFLNHSTMKKLLYLFIFCFFIAGSTFSQEIIPGSETMNIANQKALFWSSAFNKNEKNYTIGNNYDLKYYRFFWNIDPAVMYVSGHVTSHFVITENNTQLIQFELSNNLTVDSVFYHGNQVPFSHISKTVEIDLGAPIAMGVLDSVTIWYQGIPSSGGGFSSFTTSTHNSIPIMWTLSEPYGASDWWPCKNVLSDKIDSIDVFVKSPNQYRTASNGLLMSEVDDGTHLTCHWKHRYPIETYLIAIAVTNYEVYSDFATVSTGLIETVNYVYPENLTNAQSNTPKVIPCFELFDSLAGPYPFPLEKYGHAQFGWGGGMEHQTMSFMGNFSHELIAHELAHMWFGDAITCGSWQDIWLNEGFATYYTGLTYEHLFNGIYWMQWKTQVVNNITQETWGSVWCDDTTNIYRIFSGRLSYNKGAYLLHMLRWVMGDDNFYQAILNYITDPALRYGYARTSDFVAHAEAIHGQSLTWFFDQWFTGQGYPSYNIQATKLGSNELHIVISQTQSHPSVSYFAMPVPLRFSLNLQDTVVVLDNQYNNQEFTVQLNFDPAQMSFDPDLWILSRFNTTSLSIEHFDNPQITVTPNPASDYIAIQAGNNKIHTVDFFDLSGKKAHSLTVAASESINIDVSFLPKGTYFLFISGDEVSYSAKVLIQ